MRRNLAQPLEDEGVGVAPPPAEFRHGGLLDRADSLLAAAIPYYWLVRG